MVKLVRTWMSEFTKNKLKSDAAKLGLSLTEYMDKIVGTNKDNNEEKKLYRKFP